jgi:hypothetical protein
MALPQLILIAKQVAKVCNTQMNDYFIPLNATHQERFMEVFEGHIM